MPFLRNYIPQLPEDLTFAGKTVLVTGANIGLGYATALHLVQRGAETLILGVRSLEKGEAAKAEFLADPIVAARKPPPNILVLEIDMASERSVVAFAGKVEASVKNLDVAILNAGVYPFRWAVSTSTEPQREMTMQVNYVSTTLLANRLLPILRSSSSRSSSPSNLCIVGSVSSVPIDLSYFPKGRDIFDNMTDPSLFRGQKRYGESKLLLASFVESLAKEVDPKEIIVNNVCTGPVYTNLARNAPWYLKPLTVTGLYLTALGANTPEVGSRLIVRAAAEDEHTHGHLLVKGSPARYVGYTSLFIKLC